MTTCGGGTGPLCTCFSQVSSIQGLYYGQYQDYAASWELFRRVELYNSNVSSLRGEGDKSLSYWQFKTNEDLTLYRQGAFLYSQYLGYSTIVHKN
jgi:hypothetical protein